MEPYSEIEVMKLLDDALTQIQDAGAKNRILKWAWEKFSTETLPSETENKKIQKKKLKIKKPTTKSKSGPSLVKDLNLKPSSKKAFDQFIKDKQPTSNQEKCLVAGYYLKYILSRKIDVNSVYTCFKFARWRVPADLENTLCVIAVQKGWLDTSNRSDIQIPTLGENYIEHDLPRKQKGKK